MYEHLAAQYWDEVKQVLMTKYRFAEARAIKDIRGYRKRLASHGVTDALTHWDPEDTAKSVRAGIWKRPPPKLGRTKRTR